MRLITPPLVILLTSAPTVADTKEVQALQEAVHRVIDESEPSVACLLVSRSERYREFNSMPASPPGHLGSFEPPPRRPFGGDPARSELLRRLDLANPDVVPESYGSGVVIDKAGLILTHFHVVQNATKVYVRLPGKKGSYADIVAADGRSDLAVVKMINPPADLKPIKMGDGGKARKGDFVVGVANPFAAGFKDGGPTASHGIVGNLRRPAVPGGSESERHKTLQQLGILMQTDLRLNLGCSGGAVLNLNGELIALTTSTAAIMGGETPGGFAVPLTVELKRIIEVLKRGDEVEYGFLGVGFDNLNGDRDGLRIEQVSDGSPAKRAGLQVGETITAINDAPIKDFDDLQLYVGTALAGSEVTLTLRTFAARTRKVTVRLAKFVYPGPSVVSHRPPAIFGVRIDYGSVVNTDVPVPEGVYIRDVDRGSAAERKYKELLERSRWIIQSVNGKAVASPEDFYREIAAARGPLEFKIVEVVRNPETTAKTLTFP
jgi:serine protease Do